jgi:hypothetical protein
MTGTAKGVFVISFMVALWAAGAAMAGTIEGIVKDAKTGNPLAGAAVRVVNSNLGATTDLDGKYSIPNVNPGIYSLRVSFNNYTQKVLPGVAVAGKETTSMDIALDPVGGDGNLQHIDDTYVVEDRIRNNIVGELAARQKSAVIGDGMTQEQIRLSPDRDAGDALKRVTGLSVVDDKFVFVRGVTDRYNSTTLNGATVTGTDTDADKKSFSFDLIPSQLIANTIVAKTATPDLPGDFSGGLVQVNTLDLPSGFMLTGGVEAASDNVSSNKDTKVALGGGSDWKAKDDGTRAFPAGKTGNDIAKALPNNWATSDGSSNLNSNYGLAIGDRFNVGGGELGFIASGMYKNSYKIEDYHQEPQGGGQDIFNFDGKRYKEKYLWGGLANLSWHITDNHRISFENNFHPHGRRQGDAVGRRERAERERHHAVHCVGTARPLSRPVQGPAHPVLSARPRHQVARDVLQFVGAGAGSKVRLVPGAAAGGLAARRELPHLVRSQRGHARRRAGPRVPGG